MSTFTPPSANEVPPVLPDRDPTQSPLGRALFRHYRARPAGRNIYMLSDGTITETDPDMQTVFWRAEQGSPYVSKLWFGGHAGEEVTAAQEAALTSAGFGAFLT